MWILNEELLCDKEPFFRAALQSTFKEGKEKTIHLPEDDPEAFAGFVGWIYTGDEPYPEGRSSEHNMAIFRLWVFADKVGSKLADEILLDISLCQYPYLYTEGIQFVYANTPESSPLREVLVQGMLSEFYGYDVGDEHDLLSQKLEASEAFSREVMKAIREHLGAGSKDCIIFSCCVHDANRRERSNGASAELGRLHGFEGGEHPRLRLRKN